MHNTGVTESVIFMKFVQFRLHSIILNYNYFVHNSVDQLMIFFFPFEFNGAGVGVGWWVVSFSKIRTFTGGSFLCGNGRARGRTTGKGVQKRQSYANVIIELWISDNHYTSGHNFLYFEMYILKRKWKQ